MQHVYKLFFVLFLIGLSGCNDPTYVDTETPCEIVFHAKTLEGTHEINVCMGEETVHFSFSQLNGKTERAFSIPLRDVRYHAAYSDFAEEEELELYFPHQSLWYGLYLYNTPERTTDAEFSISRESPSASQTFYDQMTVLQRIVIDTESITEQIRYHAFTPF